MGCRVKKAAAALLSNGLLLSAMPVTAGWTPSQLPQLVSAFETSIAGKYVTQQYPWQWFTLADCYQPGVQCPFPNPDGPYGQPQFNGSLNAANQMNPTDAFVMIMVTPPPMLYYGVTPYLFTRYYVQVPGEPQGTSGTREILESLDDTIDMKDILTAGSTIAGVNSNSQLTAIIMTADQNTYNQLKQAFTSIKFSSVNLLDMPINLVPLYQGIGFADDYYSLMMRMAYPTDAAAMQTYIDNVQGNIYFLQVSATKPGTPTALSPPTYKVPGDGSAEPANLQTARDNLVSQLVMQYGTSYTVTEQTPLKLTQTQNFICVDMAINCDDDNSDALYTHDDNAWLPTKLQDKMLIVGVNHVSQGRATYISHSVLNMTHQAGVVAVNQSFLNGSALKMAGITSTKDPRYATYKELYAFTMSFDCTGEKVCLTIPQPTPTNPVGVTLGDTIGESFRAYVDPKTLTRPDSNELIFQRVFEMAKK